MKGLVFTITFLFLGSLLNAQNNDKIRPDMFVGTWVTACKNKDQKRGIGSSKQLKEISAISQKLFKVKQLNILYQDKNCKQMMAKNIKTIQASVGKRDQILGLTTAFGFTGQLKSEVLEVFDTTSLSAGELTSVLLKKMGVDNCVKENLNHNNSIKLDLKHCMSRNSLKHTSFLLIKDPKKEPRFSSLFSHNRSLLIEGVSDNDIGIKTDEAVKIDPKTLPWRFIYSAVK